MLPEDSPQRASVFLKLWQPCGDCWLQGQLEKVCMLLEDWQNPARPKDSGLTDIGVKDHTSY